MGFKKKLHELNPDQDESAELEIQSTKRRKKTITITPQSNERVVREILAGKLSGTHLGLWLLIPELLRLGAWDLLSGTFARRAMDPRIALQMVGEAAVCVDRLRRKGSLCNQGFSLAAGLSVLASDHSVHQLLDGHSMADYEELQVALLQLRTLAGHYHSPQVLAMDPHRMVSASRRRMPAKKKKPDQPSQKMLQTFFCTDITSRQPLAFTMGSSGKSCSHATRQLLELLVRGGVGPALLLADKEHFTKELAATFTGDPGLDILMAAPSIKKITQQFPRLDYTPLWAGYALGETTYQFEGGGPTLRLLVQREGEIPGSYTYKAFLTSSVLPAKDLLSTLYPKRWGIEEFFNFEGDMGWNRASTFNLNIRYGKGSLALLAQAATHQLRSRLPAPCRQWTARHLAEQVLTNMEGDLRVKDDTIIVTFYRDHHQLNLARHYQNLPQILASEGVCPKIPWLFDFKLDFRFK
ncbi:MAG: transposase [Balneolaceae bacterium]